MNLGNLGKVESADWYLDLAFRNAAAKSKFAKDEHGGKSNALKNADLAKIEEIKKVLDKHFTIILQGFPSVDSLAEFYQELVRLTLDYPTLKKSLGAVNWARTKVRQFSDAYSQKIKRTTDFKRQTGLIKEYFGRIGSVVKQIKGELKYLEEARRTIKEFPVIKTKMYTVAIAGFPNVGKTTLLSKLTGSTPEIANYAFTTTRLNIGYAEIEGQDVQFIDTPGTLNRLDKMNLIEKQAYLAMKYCADLIIFVFDPTEEGYESKDQKKLLLSMGQFGKKILIYVSKTDIVGEGKLPKFAQGQTLKNAQDVKASILAAMAE